MALTRIESAMVAPVAATGGSAARRLEDYLADLFNADGSSPQLTPFDWTGDGSRTEFPLTGLTAPVSPTGILVAVGGIVQNPGSSYTIGAGPTLILTEPPASGVPVHALVLPARFGMATLSDASALPVTAAGSTTPQTLAQWTGDVVALTARAGDAVNVKAAPYNAKGDGVTDDTAAIQAALDSGKPVFIPAGTYRHTGLTVTNPVVITGAGRRATTLRVSGINSNLTVNFADEQANGNSFYPLHSVFRDFCLSGGAQTADPASGAASGHGLLFKGGSGGYGHTAIMERLWIVGHQKDGIHASNGANFAFLSHCEVQTSGQHNLALSYCADWYAADCSFASATLDGVNLSESNEIVFSRCGIFANNRNGVSVDGTGNNGGYSFDQCSIDTSQRHGIADYVTSATAKRTIRDCLFHTNSRDVGGVVNARLYSNVYVSSNAGALVLAHNRFGGILAGGAKYHVEFANTPTRPVIFQGNTFADGTAAACGAYLTNMANQLYIVGDEGGGLRYSTAGVDQFVLRALALSVVNAAGKVQFKVDGSVTNAVNYPWVKGAVSGGAVVFAAEGDDTNVAARLIGKGTSGARIGAYSRAAAPTTTDITAGEAAVWKNTADGTVKLYYNDGGTLKAATLA